MKHIKYDLPKYWRVRPVYYNAISLDVFDKSKWALTDNNYLVIWLC